MPWRTHTLVAEADRISSASTDISVQLLFGLLEGTLGLLLATPLVAVGMVLVLRLYVEDVLGRP